MVDMTAHDRRTTLLAIHLYHVIYTELRTGTRAVTLFIQV